MALMWPEGIKSAGIACGIKANGDPDLGVITLAAPSAWAGTFTKNAAAAEPVRWSRARRSHPVRAIVVNSGNANACTGDAGKLAVADTTGKAAAELGCSPEEILVASTGPIGITLPVDRICDALPAAIESVSEDADGFARAILTSDTRTKSSVVTGDGFTIVGVAKGAAMLAPNMATMLAFVATDAAFGNNALDEMLTQAVRRSFDRISVDACESTNDSVFLVSSGAAGQPPPDGFATALQEVCSDLAEQMVLDAEGGSKLVRIRVRGAATEDAGVELGRAVAASALWRAAIHGADPNWGRVLSAMGAVDRALDVSKIDVSIGSVAVFEAGNPTGALDAAHTEMAGDAFDVTCTVGETDTEIEVLTTDLSPDYVTMNATGTS